ncbi:MAG: DUF2339 domain-containing protein [Lachnospiraceae bacterium]|nr:DUF2339 domain-containing protein [Lachnospiraceae bacterium]
MADIKDLEERLKQCQNVLNNVIANMNYLEREIDIAKKTNNVKPQVNLNSNAKLQGNSQGPANYGQPKGNPNQNIGPQPAPQSNPNYVNPQFNPFRGPVNQGTTYQGNTNQGKPNQGPATQGPTTQSSANNGSANQGTVNQPKKPISIESIFGKNVMAIAASVLIFISLILFATLILPKLSKEVKFFMSLAASIGVAAFGLLKWFKKKDNSFFLALGACGMGAIYITLFIGNAYFEIISYITLFVLIAVWTAVILFLSKYKKLLFEIIGYCGIIIAVMFGTISSIERSLPMNDTYVYQGANIGNFIVTIVFFLIGIIAFMIFGKMDTISYIVSNSVTFVCAIPLLIGATFFRFKDKKSIGDPDTEGILFILIILAVFYAVMLAMNLIKTKKENGVWINFFGLGHSVVIGLIVNLLFSDTDAYYPAGIIVYAITLIAIECFCIKKFDRQKFVSTYIWLSYLMIMIVAKIVLADIIDMNIGFFVAAVVFIIYGFAFNDVFYKLSGLGFNILMICCIDSTVVVKVITLVVVFALINGFMYFKNSQYSVVIKLLSYITFIIGLTFAIGYNLMDAEDPYWIHALILMVIGAINVLALKTPYRKNWEINEDDQGVIITGYAINGVLMFYALFVMMMIERNPLLHWIIVLIAVALFMVNSINLLKKWDGFGALYVGIKFTVLLITILVSFNMTDNILSILVFLLSIILISAGFIFKVKGLRIYGLVLSLICVIKLVMIDITYENTVGHALSFFLSGVLCFVISAIYSHVEKKYKDSEAVSM